MKSATFVFSTGLCMCNLFQIFSLSLVMEFNGGTETEGNGAHFYSFLEMTLFLQIADANPNVSFAIPLLRPYHEMIFSV